jgi:hypothetical protein
VALTSLPRAAHALRRSFLVPEDALYVVVDATRSPGREVAVLVIAEQHRMTPTAALAFVDERSERSAKTGLPFIVSSVVGKQVVLSLLPVLQRRMLARGLASPKPAFGTMCVVAIAGAKVRLEHLPIESL